MKAVTVNEAHTEVILVGEVTWSELSSARGFKDPKTGQEDDKKFFNITIKVGKDDAEKVMESLDEISSKMLEAATEGLTTAKKRAISSAAPKYKLLEDAAGELTGEIKIDIRRPEKLGAPKLRDEEGKVVERKFISRGSTVAIRATVRHYLVGGKAGAAYTLQDIKLLNEVKSDFTPQRKTDPEMDKLMGAVDLNDLPF